MKKYLFIFFFVGFVASSVRGQLQEGSTAPDFTVVDIEGNTHNLYDYVGQGKTVILNFFSTDCPSCAVQFQTNVYQDLYQIVGPGGLNKLEILFIEANSNTTVENIQGEGSFLDWTENIPYPIINDVLPYDLYELVEVPTVIKICPSDTTIYYIGDIFDILPTPEVIVDSLVTNILDVACMPPTHNHDLAILKYIGNNDVCYNQNFSFEVEIINLGIQNTSDVVLNITTSNDVTVQFPIPGFLSTYETYTYAGNLVLENEINSLSFYTICTMVDGYPPNNTLDIPLEPILVFEEPFIEVEIQTDNYGFDTYWEITDDDGNVYASGGNPTATPGGGDASQSEGYENDTLYTIPVSLLDGCNYSFSIIDDFGDGICCNDGDGYFKLKNYMGEVVVSSNELEEDFTRIFTKRFAIGDPFVTDLFSISPSLSTMKLYPVPASQFVQLEFPDRLSGVIYVYNILGQTQLEISFDDSEQLSINTASLQTGVYTMSVETANKIYSQQFIVQQ